MFKILAATGNKHKLKEFQEMLDKVDFGEEVKVVGPDEIGGISDVEEDGETFEENAVKKAVAASKESSIAAFADDSGLEVEALDGAPGVKSARFAGPDARDEDRIAKLLHLMEGVENRRAKFVCVLAIANEGELLATFRGEVSGVILTEPHGSNGFGYDPVFRPDGCEQTFAEMKSEEKDKISHRARAMEKAVEFVEDAMSLTM